MPASATPAPPGTPLVLTKVRPPAPRDLVPRPALVERLAGGPPRRLTVVRAPAGFGKTTLLSAWASSPAEARPFAWLSLDASDSSPQRFWAYVGEALRAVDERVADAALPVIRAPGVDLREAALPVLLNELAAMGVDAVLVLDDYHLVTHHEVHASLAYFVEHLPPGVEVAIATRTAPPLPLARLRACGDLVEIDEALLRFSAVESDSLLNSVARLDLDAAAVERLHRRTEGWAAALYLAALSLRDRADRAAFIDAFSGDDRHVVEYLSAEVLSGLPGDLRTFLLRTSILDRLNGPLCDAVVGTADGTRLLREVERSNLFLVALDDRRREYRYHHLFGDLLRAELEATAPELVPELHRRAARFFAGAGDADGAIRHTTAAGDIEEAIELVAAHWSSWLLERGDRGAIDGWLRALPDGVVGSDPRLCVARTFTNHSLGRARDATAWVSAAEGALGEDAPARIRGDVAAARASNALQTGDNGRALAAAERSLAIGDPASPWVPIPHGVRGHARRWSGDAVGGAAGLRGWVDESEARGQLLGVVGGRAALALIAAEAGDEAAARAHADAAIDRGGACFAEHWVTVDAWVTRALLDGDRAAARRAVELAGRGGPPAQRANAYVAAASVLGREEATSLVAEAEAILAPCPDPGALVLERVAVARLRVEARGPDADVAVGDELSDRELAVLRLLATELSQREIGDALYVSMNTVKTHARHIFRKLGASGRDDAVARARDAGLLR